jgi:hypothetical protein
MIKNKKSEGKMAGLKNYAVKYIARGRIMEKLMGAIGADLAIDSFRRHFPDFEVISARLCGDGDAGRFYGGLRVVGNL